MGFKSKVLAAAAAVTLSSGLALAGASVTWGATPSCGHDCVNIFSKQFGSFSHPGFTMDVFRQGAKVGQPIILWPGTNHDPALDINPSFQGNTSDFFGAGLVSSAVELHYGGAKGLLNPPGNTTFPDDPAFELEYTPYGVGSGLCVGVATTAHQGEKVSLQPCGASSKTVWILDIPLRLRQQSDGCPLNPLYFLEAPLINGSDTNFSHPFVLTYPANGFPTDKPRPQLTTNNLTGFTQDGSLTNPVCGTNSVPGPNSNQEWAATFGPITS